MVIVVAVIAALAIAAAVIAVVVSNGSSSNGAVHRRPVADPTRHRHRHGADPLPEDGADPAIGVTAPTLAGLSFDGTPVNVGGPTTNATLVVFAAHWCPHCQREIPKLADWQPPAGVAVVAVATQTSEDAPNYPPSSWLTKAGWTWPVLADSPTYQAAAAYGMVSWPAFVLLDKDGVVRWRGTGEIELDTLTSTISTALGETSSSTPPTA